MSHKSGDERTTRPMVSPYEEVAIDLCSGPVADETLLQVETGNSTREYPPCILIQNPYEKYLFVCIAGFSSNVSMISIPMFFPALNVLAKSFHTSVEMINLTATMYSIFQGISPLLFCSLADTCGRRPVYMACLVIAMGANVGLALCRDYWVLFGLRCLQAFGAASTVSLQAGVVGDLTQRKNRGGLMALSSGLGYLGNCFGPIIGGCLIQRWDWPSIFWFNAALAGFTSLLIFFLLPETRRQFVGDGSVIPKRILNKSPYVYVRRLVCGLPYSPKDSEYEHQWLAAPPRASVLQWARILLQPDVILVLTPTAIHYTTWYMVLTAQSTLLGQKYGFSSEKIGYTYLASGAGTLIASILSGRLMQWVYRRECQKIEMQCAEEGRRLSLKDLNIYYVRLGQSFYASGMSIAATLVFGWSIEYQVSFYVPVVMSFFISASTTYFMATTSTILVDLFPDDSSTAVSCMNLTRCLLCAAGIAAVDRMDSVMGAGPTFVIMAGFCALSLVLIFTELKVGSNLERTRREKSHSVHKNSGSHDIKNEHST